MKLENHSEGSRIARRPVGQQFDQKDEGIQSSIPSKLVVNVHSSVQSVEVKTNSESKSNSEENWLPQVDLSYLSNEQKGLVEELLRKECVFKDG